MSGTPASAASAAPPPSPNSAYVVPCSQVNDAHVLDDTGHPQVALAGHVAARAATFCAATAGVVTTRSRPAGSMRARPICTSPVPGGMSMSR